MKIYHTETQADYDALLIRLKELGYKYINGSEFSEERPYVIVWWTDMVMRSYQDLMEDEEFKSLPIIKYKAKADEKMRFTKENVYKVFSQYRKDSNYSLNDLQDEILKLDDTPEKVVVPKTVALFYENVKHYKLEEAFNQFEKTSDREVSNWYFNRKGRYDNNIVNAQETIAKMHLYGYEIEKEQLYEVVIHETEDDRFLLVTLENGGYKFEFESDNEGFWKQRHTESEIKKMDKRYWAFAVPVEEEE